MSRLSRTIVVGLVLCFLATLNPSSAECSENLSQPESALEDLHIPVNVFIFNKAQPLGQFDSVIINADNFIDSAQDTELLRELYQSGKAIYIVGTDLEPGDHDNLFEQITGSTSRETVLFDDDDFLLATGVLKSRHGSAQIYVLSDAPGFRQSNIDQVAKLHTSILENEQAYNFAQGFPNDGAWPAKHNSQLIVSKTFTRFGEPIGSFTQYGSVKLLEDHNDAWNQYVNLQLTNESSPETTYGYNWNRIEDECAVTLQADDNLIDYQPGTSFFGIDESVEFSLTGAGPSISWSFNPQSTNIRNRSSMAVRRMLHVVEYSGPMQADTHTWRPGLQHQNYRDYPWQPEWSFGYTFENTLKLRSGLTTLERGLNYTWKRNFTP